MILNYDLLQKDIQLSYAENNNIGRLLGHLETSKDWGYSLDTGVYRPVMRHPSFTFEVAECTDLQLLQLEQLAKSRNTEVFFTEQDGVKAHYFVGSLKIGLNFYTGQRSFSCTLGRTGETINGTTK